MGTRWGAGQPAFFALLATSPSATIRPMSKIKALPRLHKAYYHFLVGLQVQMRALAFYWKKATSEI